MPTAKDYEKKRDRAANIAAAGYGGTIATGIGQLAAEARSNDLELKSINRSHIEGSRSFNNTPLKRQTRLTFDRTASGIKRAIPKKIDLYKTPYALGRNATKMGRVSRGLGVATVASFGTGVAADIARANYEKKRKSAMIQKSELTFLEMGYVSKAYNSEAKRMKRLDKYERASTALVPIGAASIGAGVVGAGNRIRGNFKTDAVKSPKAKKTPTAAPKAPKATPHIIPPAQSPMAARATKIVENVAPTVDRFNSGVRRAGSLKKLGNVKLGQLNPGRKSTAAIAAGAGLVYAGRKLPGKINEKKNNSWSPYKPMR